MIKYLPLILLVSFSSIAAKKCDEAKVQHIQKTQDKVLVQLEGQNWQTLGLTDDEDLKKKIKRLNKAKRLNANVILKFDNQHDCQKYDENMIVKSVKIVKPKKS